MSSPAILSCGEVLWDLFPDGPRFGGAPANFACHAAFLGGNVSMLSGIGVEARGDAAVAILDRFGVDTALVQRIAGLSTGTVGVELDSSGKPSFKIHAPSAWDAIEWTQGLAARLAEIDAIYFGTLGQRESLSRGTIRKALEFAKARGIPRVLDINLRSPFYDPAMIRSSITLASILKLSDDELREVAAGCEIPAAPSDEETLRAICDRFRLSCVVMTRGAKGAVLVSADEIVQQAGIPTQVVDTVGAGDSFTAAFTLGILRGETTADILRKACQTASGVCAQAGAVPTR